MVETVQTGRMSYLPRVLAMVLIVCSLLIVWQLFRVMMADLIAYRAEYAIEQWQKNKTTPKADDLDKALSDIDSAISWQPDNPELLDVKVQLLLYLAYADFSNTERFRSSISAGLDLSRQSVQLRPRWPYSWANLALAKAYLNQNDDEFATALKKSARFGPWEPSVQSTLAEAGMVQWNGLDKSLRQVVSDNIYRGLLRNSVSMKAVVDRHRKRFLVCAYLPVDKRTNKFCLRS